MVIGQQGRTFNDIEMEALEADRLGFHSIWLADHFFFTGSPFLECFSTLAALSQITDKVRLGSLVACNSYRSPAHLAKIVATLDNISNGRVEFGIGAGWYEDEYRAYGYQFPSARERILRLDEGVQIIKRLWSEDSTSFHGRYYSVEGAVCNPKPIQRPHPPIWIGGSGRMLLGVAARHADGCNIPIRDFTPQAYSEKLAILKEQCSKTGRDVQNVRQSMSVILSVEERQEDVKRGIMNTISRLSSDRSIKYNVLALFRQPRYIWSLILTITGIRKPFFMVAGTPEQCTNQLQAFADMGVELFMVSIANERKKHRALELVMDKVAPEIGR